jgi:hypothetical protein
LQAAAGTKVKTIFMPLLEAAVAKRLREMQEHAPQAATQKAIVSPVPEETPVIPNTQPPPSVDPEVKAQPLTVTDTKPHKTNKVMWTFLALVRIQCLEY